MIDQSLQNHQIYIKACKFAAVAPLSYTLLSDGKTRMFSFMETK